MSAAANTSGPVAWIAVDWGTSRLRGWAMAADGRPVEARDSADGMGGLAPDQFGPALDRLTAGWPGDVPVIACGMVGSRQGWVEAPYAAVPCAPLAVTPVRVPGPRAVHIVPGLKQAAPPDVMRGEETQIAGYLAAHPGWDGVICLPGTHTKWAEISAGEVVSFRTFMTGELYALLSAHSVLRHSVAEGWDEAAFAAGVDDAIARPAEIAALLFRIRADHLLNGTAPGRAAARLSGLLIGAELAAARPYWLGREVAIIGADRIAAAYAAALSAQAVPVDRAGAEDMTLRGLAAARLLLGATR